MEERLSKEEAMGSANNRQVSGTPTTDEYKLMGHEAYFEKYSHYYGMTREQVEVANREWTADTWTRLYNRESDAIDNF